MKHCLACGQDKETASYPKDKSRKDGLYVYCKECCSARTRNKRPPVSGMVQPLPKTLRDTKRQRMIAKHGISIVEVMESGDGCFADLRDLCLLP